MAGEKDTKESKTAAAGNTGSGGSDSNMWAALCYVFPILVSLLVLFLMEDKKKDKFLMFHAWQSLILGAVVWGISFVLSFVLIGCITGAFGWLYMLYLGYKAYQGEKFSVPTISEYAENQMK